MNFNFLETNQFRNPIWLNAEWNDENKAFVYSENTKASLNDAVKRKKMMAFDKDFMVNETKGNDSNTTYIGAIVYRKSDLKGRFGLRGERKDFRAMALCRAFPVVPIGIQTLNTMLDPSKVTDRKEKVETAKESYHNDFGQLDISKSYEKFFELLWYTRLPCFDVKDVTSKKKDEMSIIKRCYWRGQMVDCASIFVTKPTDRGMCCTFNVENAEKSLKASKYQTVTSKLQKEDMQQRFGGRPIG